VDNGTRKIPGFAVVVVALKKEVDGVIFVDKSVGMTGFAGIPSVGCTRREYGVV
jgi:hypothetical protein